MEYRDGVKFAKDERASAKALAAQMSASGQSQRAIAAHFGVSQPTICDWLRSLAPPSTPQIIAEKIRAELVCCNVFERMEKVRGNAAATARLRKSNDFHPICYYGEWSARIAEHS